MKRTLILGLLLVLVGCESGESEEEAIGACCNGADCTLVSEASCGGLFIGGVCAPHPCEMLGACCEVGGDCSQTTRADCGSAFFEEGADCSMCPTNAACCDEENSCTEVERAEDCDGRPIIRAPCDPDPCETPPPVSEACCNGTECSVRTAAECRIPSCVAAGIQPALALRLTRSPWRPGAAAS